MHRLLAALALATLVWTPAGAEDRLERLPHRGEKVGGLLGLAVWSVARRWRLANDAMPLELERCGQHARGNCIATIQHYHIADDVLHLPHIAGPIIGLYDPFRRAVEPVESPAFFRCTLA